MVPWCSLHYQGWVVSSCQSREGWVWRTGWMRPGTLCPTLSPPWPLSEPLTISCTRSRSAFGSAFWAAPWSSQSEIVIEKFQFVGNNNRTSSVSQLATDLPALNCNNARNISWRIWQIIIHPIVTKQMQSCCQPETAQLEIPLAFDSASWLWSIVVTLCFGTQIKFKVSYIQHTISLCMEYRTEHFFIWVNKTMSTR